MGKYSDAIAPLIAPFAQSAPTPENTPIPGGGSWRWDITLPGWVENQPDQPLQPGDIGALQTDTPKE